MKQILFVLFSIFKKDQHIITFCSQLYPSQPISGSCAPCQVGLDLLLSAVNTALIGSLVQTW